MMLVYNKYGTGLYRVQECSNGVGEEDVGARSFQKSDTYLPNMVQIIEDHNLRGPQTNVIFVVCLVPAHAAFVDLLS